MPFLISMEFSDSQSMIPLSLDGFSRVYFYFDTHFAFVFKWKLVCIGFFVFVLGLKLNIVVFLLMIIINKINFRGKSMNIFNSQEKFKYI